MFFPGSRYERAGTYPVTLPDGTIATVTRIPLPRTDPLVGYHPRVQGQRLDLIASHYLADPTTFWRLCDANNAIAPDALAMHDLVGIPGKAR
jgi:hypothetical protein